MGFLGNSMAASVDRAERPVARAERRRMVFAPPSDRERAFAKARRHSLWVRFLRKAVLAGAVGSVAAMVLIGIYNPFSTKLGSLSFSQISIDGTKIAMARPKLAGFRSDGQPYEMTAERAFQDVRQPTVVELEKVSGEIGATDGETTRLTADTGVYDSVAERMKLSRNVRIASARFEVRLRSADIDFKTGVYQSDEPVEVRVGDGTTITGDRATSRNNGQEFIFEGRVRTTIKPPADTADADSKRTSR
ncbi:MAG TPA: LPS export ABC transporter periplasmic protein LptC [Roseiarcus sp.]|jgi:lipopolysaccharide export system protein LptC|nr:LPS export ABC transporter periplasmic protein LptC [Roseiarcus sp.]